MFPFPQSVTPAVRSHLDAQVAFMNDMSQSLTRSFQSVCELHLQLGQTMLEEGNIASQQFLTTNSASEAVTVASARAQPTADKLRAYQQHIARVMADTQVDLARVTEQHSQLTSRTARELADQVAQAAADEAQKATVKQRDMMKSFRDPFLHHAAHGNMQGTGEGGMGVRDHDSQRTAAYQGSEQSGQAAPGKSVKQN